MTLGIAISGGLGNQLFQLCFARAMYKSSNEKVYLDVQNYVSTNHRNLSQLLSERNDSFEIGQFQQANSFRSFLGTKKTKSHFMYLGNPGNSKQRNRLKVKSENYRQFIPEFKQLRNAYFMGAFASYKYWEPETQAMIDWLREQILKMENNFELSSKYDLAIHARRGDYVSNPKTREFHGYCGESYFQKSLEVIESLDHSIRTVLVSSDDSVFAHHLANLARRFFPRVSILEEPSALKALVHLSNSRIFVGSNSTFSWWAGYLYPKEIRVFPRNWFRSHKVDFSHDFLFFDDPILLDELLES